MPESKGQLSRFTAIFAGGTMLSRVSGLIRDIVTAALIPPVALDAFLFAFRLPNMLRDMLAEGATNAAFIPVLTESQEKESPEEFQGLIAALLSAMTIILGIVTVLGILVMPVTPYILEALRPLTGGESKPAAEIAETVRLMQWTFPYLFLIGIAAYAMAPLFTVKKYGTASWSPTLLNVAFVVAAFALFRTFENPAWALVVGVWLGGIAQLVVMSRAMYQHTGVLWPSFRLGHPGVRKACWLLVPIVLGQAAGEVNKLVDSFFAYSLEEGTVTALFYANRLIQLPLSIFGVAVSVAILPSIARAAARGEHGEIRDTLLHGYRQTFFLIMPAMLGLVWLREPMMSLLFERGEFSADVSARGATALLYSSVGLLSFSWVKVSVQGFYAVQDTKTPVIIATASMLMNILLICALVGPMGFRGLVLATTLSYTMNFILLYVFLNARYGLLWDRATRDCLLRVSLAGVMMSAVMIGLYARLADFADSGGFLGKAVAVFVPGGAGVIVYLALCQALHVPEMSQILNAFRGKAGKKKKSRK